jgi:hypothetical protein
LALRTWTSQAAAWKPPKMALAKRDLRIIITGMAEVFEKRYIHEISFYHISFVDCLMIILLVKLTLSRRLFCAFPIQIQFKIALFFY